MAQTTSVLDEDEAAAKPLSIMTKLLYGTGDWGRASYNTLRQVFYAIFLTDVVGIDPRLASIAALVSVIWDAINDPIVGNMSDNVRTRWGRRRPFMLLFSIPFAFAFVMLWWAPPWETQTMLVIHVTLAYMLSDTLQTLVTVPYLALTPELAPKYDERTSLTTFRMFFNLAASLVTAVAAPTIMDAVVNTGASQQQAYLMVGALFGGIAVIPFFFIFFFIKEKEIVEAPDKVKQTFKQTMLMLWRNVPFRYATGIYVMNWIAVDVISLMLPYFLLYWIARGDLLLKASVFGVKISLDSVVLGAMMLTATATLPLWNFLAQKFSKQRAYIIGMVFWIVVELLVLFIPAGAISLAILLAVMAGFSISTAHVIPESIFPDVIDWDELVTNTRREGMYYGAINFIRKMASALAIFLVLQALGWLGYQNPPAGAVQFLQSPQTLLAIRVLSGPLIAIFLITAVVVALRYPLTRERQAMIHRTLLRRRRRRKNALPAVVNPLRKKGFEA